MFLHALMTVVNFWKHSLLHMKAMASVNVFEEGSLALKSDKEEQVKKLYDRLVGEIFATIATNNLMKKNVKNLSRNYEVEWCLKLVDNKDIQKMIPLRYIYNLFTIAAII